MKQAYVFYVMILSLLLAVCGCSNDSIPNQETGFESPQDSGIEQKDTGDKEPVTSDVQEQNVPLPPEPETPDVTPPEIVPPIANPPVAVPPVINPPEPVPPSDIPPVVNPPEPVPPSDIPPVVNPPEPVPPSDIPPVVNPPEPVPPSDIPPVVNPPEVVPTLVNLLEINELRTEYSSASKRVEYIEFKVKQAGNLNGISLHIMYDANKPFTYIFPAIDVAIGDYITLHLRSMESTCINELGANLSVSHGTDSCSTARDLWVSGSGKLLHQTDIVYLQDANGKLLDAIIMNEAPSAAWNKNQSHFAAISEYLFNNGMWKSVDGKMPSPFDAVDTSSIKTAATRSISRYEQKENSHTANDWYITDTNEATPGLPNK